MNISTPPWIIDYKQDDGWLYIRPFDDNAPVCSILMHGDPELDAKAHADATLIVAAAPLLAACETALAALKSAYIPNAQAQYAVLDQLEAVIAKARRP